MILFGFVFVLIASFQSDSAAVPWLLIAVWLALADIAFTLRDVKRGQSTRRAAPLGADAVSGDGRGGFRA